ncbi:hypothetical protein [Pararhizobium sp. O133]|uniref:hypothetical protein n=1 Tax=Pararhizobium sp. O133 TaxID=3449278 RepID=UPI003F683FCF
MKFRTADLAFHPSLRDWMARHFGEFCAATDVLMMLTVVYIGHRYSDDLEARHMQVVRKIRRIAASAQRPQRVPTFKEFLSLADAYDRSFFLNTNLRRAKLVQTKVSSKLVEEITMHEKAAATLVIERRHAA